MLPLRQATDVKTAALNDSRPGHRDILEAAAALRNYAGRAARVERWQKSVAECFHLGKGVRLTTLIHDGDDLALLDRQLVGFEVPALRIGVRRGVPILGHVEKIAQGGRKTKGGKRNVVTKAASAFAKQGVKRWRIA